MDKATLDRIDSEIVRLLQKNAWKPNKQIAAAVGLAPSTCHERIKNLQRSGVIRGAHADVDLRAVGLNLEVLAFIKLAKYERGAIDQFMSDMESVPEVRRVFLVSGRHDVIVHLAVKDIDHLRNLGFDRITSQPMVVSIETSFVYDSRGRNELSIFSDGGSTDSAQATKGSAQSKKHGP
ncbi:MAG TPA: Lrp/AsnC family transcriptional regulator [Terriglobales bacterium]|nr:Lrp/AsnC family transcriptional regulator [Terriglobales bacterium]